jgi:hypothetical protein
MSCNSLYVSEGLLHPCSGAEEFGCEVAWDCLSEDLSSMSSERADSYLDALERQSERG